ncbi:MAG: hypothetical protein JWN04_1690, partial [Myxococcaceae bacterium]|nr:hypothetical protein [Myxococcaceae bacterium]
SLGAISRQARGTGAIEHLHGAGIDLLRPQARSGHGLALCRVGTDQSKLMSRVETTA